MVTTVSGKGSRSRVRDLAKFRRNFDDIKWPSKVQPLSASDTPTDQPVVVLPVEPSQTTEAYKEFDVRCTI